MPNIDKITLKGTDYTIIDSTVPSWAKQSTKPSYNYSEINNTPTLTTPVIDYSSNSSNSFTLDANKYYNLGTRSAITLALNAGTSGELSVYCGKFFASTDNVTINLPSGVEVATGIPSILTLHYYEFSIVDNIFAMIEGSVFHTH